MKALSAIFCVFAVLLSDVMCAVAAYNYCDIIWGIQYAGYSAPVSVAFFTAIPYAIAMIVCIVLAVFFKKKAA